MDYQIEISELERLLVLACLADSDQGFRTSSLAVELFYRLSDLTSWPDKVLFTIELHKPKHRKKPHRAHKDVA